MAAPPRCPRCKLSMGWTRYIRCTYYRKPVLCEACSFKNRQHKPKYRRKLRARGER